MLSKIKYGVLPILPLLAGCGEKEAKTEKPNVIIILADDIGYGDLGWLGAETVETPHVNQLADEGLRLTNCHATSATSTPSRYGMLTGMYPWRRPDTGIAAGDAAMIIKPHEYTMADMFRDAGYATGAIGKWHLGIGDVRGAQDWNGTITPGLESIGFDYSFIMAATGDRVPCVYIENGRAVGLDPNDPIEVSYTEPFEGEPTGKNNPELLRLHPSHGHDMAIVDGISRIGYMRGGMSARWHDEDIADDITNKAVEFIDKNKDRAFFLYLGTNDIHVPRVPHERFQGKSGMGARGDAILSFDATVGRVMHVLDSLNIADNTLIILSSDNGPVVDDGYKDDAVELLGNHKPAHIYRGGKYSAFEAGTRVPCIVRWKKGIQSNLTSDALISQIDFFASLKKLIQGEIPEKAASDSREHLDVLLGKTEKGSEYVIEQNLANTLSIYDGVWKYIEPSKASPYNFNVNIELGNSEIEQLYNLSADPGEKENMASQNREKLSELKTQLSRERDK